MHRYRLVRPRGALEFRGRNVLLAATCLLAAGLLNACNPAGRPSPVQELASYPDALEKPIEDKVSRGTPALIDWQHRINLKYGQDVRPRPAAANHPLIPKVRAMLRALPPQIHRLASRHIVALYLLEGDYGTGTTEAVRDAQGRWLYTYMALNLSVLNRTANQWGSWKESSAFHPVPGPEIRMVLEEAADDTVTAAIRFIFLHELGHALGLSLKAHGWWDAPALPPETRASHFMRISWRPDASGADLVTAWHGKFTRLGRLNFYAFDKAELPLSEAEAAYRDLSRTDLPSLYGATNYFDDFAESFAIYVHTRLLKKPYRVETWQGGARRFVFQSCIQTGGCAEKVRALEAVIGLER